MSERQNLAYWLVIGGLLGTMGGVSLGKMYQTPSRVYVKEVNDDSRDDIIVVSRNKFVHLFLDNGSGGYDEYRYAQRVENRNLENSLETKVKSIAGSNKRLGK